MLFFYDIYLMPLADLGAPWETSQQTKQSFNPPIYNTHTGCQGTPCGPLQTPWQAGLDASTRAAGTSDDMLRMVFFKAYTVPKTVSACILACYVLGWGTFFCSHQRCPVCWALWYRPWSFGSSCQSPRHVDTTSAQSKNPFKSSWHRKPEESALLSLSYIVIFSGTDSMAAKISTKSWSLTLHLDKHANTRGI